MGEFEKTLTKQFISYWQSLPGMWSQDAHDIHEWQQLFKANKERDIPFSQYWRLMETLIIEGLGWSRKRYEERWLFFEPPGHPTVDQVAISVFDSVDGQVGWESELGKHVLYILLRFRNGEKAPSYKGKTDIEGRWIGTLQPHTKTREREQYRVLVGIPNWDKCGDTSSRNRAVAHTVIAGLKMIAKVTQIAFDGLESVYD
jgi:hypothetical protein